MEKTIEATARQRETTTRAGTVFQGRVRARNNGEKSMKFVDLAKILCYALVVGICINSSGEIAELRCEAGIKLSLASENWDKPATGVSAGNQQGAGRTIRNGFIKRSSAWIV